MPEIKLVMNNRTALDLIFKYNDVEYEVRAKRSERTTVEAGHRISVRDPNQTRVTRNKITVESDFFVPVLDRDIAIDCELIAWQLKLRLGVDVL